MIWDRIAPRLEELVRNGRFTLGPELERFEEQAAAAFGCEWCVGTSSGTSALYLALRAAPLEPKARVIIPANTFFATFEAVVQAGMIPVVVDHDEDFLLDLDALHDVRAEAVLPVHLYGLPVDMPALIDIARQKGWWVLEDCSQSHGATIKGRPVGSYGDAGAFSAYPTKNLGAWGDAGFVTGSDKKLEEDIRMLRHHGQQVSNRHELIGGTHRMDNIQAVVLSEKLGLLNQEVQARRKVASRYRASIGDHLPVPGDRGARLHAYHQFVVRTSERDWVRKALLERGVQTGVHYPVPVHLQPGASGCCEIPVPPQRAESWASQILSLPIYAGLREEEMDRVTINLLELRGSIEADRSRL
jgi:dTDP-4-amino-4,6-dideoxygalactose transaminase